MTSANEDLVNYNVL